MTIDYLKKLLTKGLSVRQISNQSGKSFSTVKYWLNKYELKTNFEKFNRKEPIVYGKFRYCPRCKQDCETINFYNRKGIPFASTYCKKCAGNQALIRTQNFKLKCVEYKGGKCVICGYNKYIGALEFHHLDRTTKDFSIGKMRGRSFDKIKIELDKCELLCANCHREVEAGAVVPA